MSSILKVFSHEFKMYIRDRKLLVNTILLPILIYPLIIIVIALGAFFAFKSEVAGFKVNIQGDNKEITEAIKNTKSIKILEDKIYTDKDILERNIDAIIIVSEDINVPIKIKYDATKKSFISGNITDTIDKLKEDHITSILKDKGLEYESINPISISEFNNQGEEVNMFAQVASLILPMLFLLFPLISTSYLTTDLAAGEKEKMTLEPLICTKVPRYKLLLGKLLFVSVVSIIISLIAVFVLLLTIMSAISLSGLPISGINFNALGLLLSLFILTLTVIFLSALQLTVSFFAKNYKESQILLSPLLIILMVPMVMSMFIPESPLFYNLPIFNVVLILKQLISGIINLANVFTVIGWLCVYIVLSLLLCIKAVNNEKFIFRV